MTLEEKVVAVKTALEDRKAVDVRAYDVRGLSGFADAFVVATGTAEPHLKGLANGVLADLKERGFEAYRPRGAAQGGWTVLDYVDVVVHLFTPEARAYYALEKLWATAQSL